jgi:voltage-gated potassium channel Kch
MKPDFKWREKLHYKLDNMFSRGTGVMMLWLGIFSLIIVFMAAVVIVVLNIAPPGEPAPDFLEAFWQSLMRTLDPGTMGGDVGWRYRIVMFLVTMGGIFVISTLIGLISSGIEQRLEDLQRGRSRVIETGHTVILGWNEQVFTIIDELVTANANLPDSCIVIMGPSDKIEMENEIHEKVRNTGNTRIVVRTGNPIEMDSLDILNLNTAKAIIVLAPNSTDPDSEVIKTCLAITRNPNRKADDFHIVAELRNSHNLDVARVVGDGEVEWLMTGEIIARVVAQTCRQSGLSVVYTDLLDFGGDEIYFYENPDLYGLTFGEVLNCFEKNAVMGLQLQNGKPILNPPMDVTLEAGDQLFLLAEDDDRIFVRKPDAPLIDKTLIRDGVSVQRAPENTLMLGWNWRAPLILQELDQYVPSESRLTIVCDAALAVDESGWSGAELKNMMVAIRHGDTSDRALLDSLNLEKVDHIVLLCYSDSLPVQAADARTLITLLHLRDIASKNPACHYSITSEMLDIRNRNLAEVTKADDFIVSEKLISLMFAQVAEAKALNAVFADIFDPEGSEIYLKPAGSYVALDQPVNFYTVVEAARRQGQIALGYRLFADRNNAEHSYGIVLNPAKSERVSLNKRDKIIVIAKY